jgi:hypothetical protein
MSFHPVFERMGTYKYRWPDGEVVTYEEAIFFTVKIDEKKVPVVVALEKRERFGKVRRRAIVFVKDVAEVEFTGTDNYDETGNLVCPLKKIDSEEMFRINESIPDTLMKFPIVYHKDYIRDGFDRLGVLVNCSDLKLMIDYALTRARMEGRV